MTKYQVVKATELDAEKLTFEDLRCHFRTGRSYVISGTGRDRKTGYRTGIQTDVGDIEVSEWKMLMKDLIRRSDEEILYELLFQWVSQTMLWLHTKQEQELEALELHAMRIFDNPLWVDYIPFNRKYRPEVLASAKLVWIQTDCCRTPAQITQEQLEKNTSNTYGVPCPLCGRWSAFHVCPPEEVSEDG